MTLAGIHHSQGSDLWATPQPFFDRLDQRFKFQLDACAQEWNSKCDKFYSETQNGLTQPWESWTWCNPPYSQIKWWYAKALHEACRGASSVLLTFARTDTKAFHEYVMLATEIIFIKGRIRFVDPATRKISNPAPAPSMLVIYDAKDIGAAKFSTMPAK